MTRTRFEDILRNLHFSQKMAKVTNVVKSDSLSNILNSVLVILF